MGHEDIPDYDPVPPLLSDVTSFLRGVLERHCISGVPPWPFVASTLYATLLAGETGPAQITSITWDASLHGWAWTSNDGQICRDWSF